MSFTSRTESLGVDRIAALIRLGGRPLPEGKRGLRWLHRFEPHDRARIAEAWLEHGRGSWGAFLLREVPADSARAQHLVSASHAEARERAFTRWQTASKRQDGSIDLEAIAWLPSDLRAREAKRHLHDVSALLTRPRERASYARYLSFIDAKEELAAWLGHPEGEERAYALRIWISAVRFDRASLPDALAAVKARKFEQDPVRSAMIEALVDLPLGAFTSAHLADVGQILQDAIDAADLSQTTAWAAERLVVRLFRRDPAWGAAWLPRLLKVRGSISALGLGDGLTATEVAALAPALSTLIEAWMARERSPAILWLGRSLGRRLPLVAELVTALELCAEDAPYAATSALALDLLKRHARPRFNALVPRLVTADRSFALLGLVARFVSHVRQDLLDPLLDGTRVTGRFATGKTSWVLGFDGGYERWNDRQQEAYARRLGAIISDAAREVPAVLSSLETLASLAFVDPKPFLALASDTRLPVRERAVRYLARIDGGEGVPLLVECLGDDRARFAVYSLRKAFAEMRPEEVIGVLGKAPMNKVTVAKEVLRLTGELPGEAAFAALLSFDKPTLHRDVRIALLRALWDHLERPEAWAVFERAAGDPDWVVVSRLADIPVDRLSSWAEAKLAALLAQVLARPEVEARLELLRKARGLPLRDADRALFKVCLARMGGPHPEESKVATEAALSRMLPSEASAIVSRMRELVADRRLLLGFIEVLAARVHAQVPEPIRRVGEGLFDLLGEDPRLAPLVIRFAPRVRAWRELGELLIHLAAKDLLHVDAMVEAFASTSGSSDPELLEATLAEAGDARLRRIALSILCSAAGASIGWTPERRARLERYRLDASPLVAGAAERVFPPE